VRSIPLKQTRRIPPAGRSHLGLFGRWLRWARVGGGAGRDCTQLGVELGEPLVLALQPRPDFSQLQQFCTARAEPMRGLQTATELFSGAHRGWGPSVTGTAVAKGKDMTLKSIIPINVPLGLSH